MNADDDAPETGRQARVRNRRLYRLEPIRMLAAPCTARCHRAPLSASLPDVAASRISTGSPDY